MARPCNRRRRRWSEWLAELNRAAACIACPTKSVPPYERGWTLRAVVILPLTKKSKSTINCTVAFRHCEKRSDEAIFCPIALYRLVTARLTMSGKINDARQRTRALSGRDWLWIYGRPARLHHDPKPSRHIRKPLAQHLRFAVADRLQINPRLL